MRGRCYTREFARVGSRVIRKMKEFDMPAAA
jgi:hypothetical protein